MKHNRNKTILRTWRILLRLAKGPVTTDELAREAGVTERTIRRDLGVLEEVGFPIVDDRDWRQSGRVTWSLVEGYSLPRRLRDLRVGVRA